MPSPALAVPPELAIGALSAFAVGLGKGGLAMMGTFGVPLLALAISPIRAAAVLLPVFVFSDVFAIWLYRREFSARNLRILIPAATVGIGVGWLLAARISDAGVGILVGVLGLGFCANSWRLRHRKPVPHGADVPRGAIWGSLLGFASFVSHAGAPPFQIYVLPQRLPKAVYAGTSAFTFAAVNAIKLVPYGALGQLSGPNLRLAAWLLLPALIGTQVGRYAVKVLPERIYYAFLQVALAAISVDLIIKGLLG